MLRVFLLTFVCSLYSMFALSQIDSVNVIKTDVRKTPKIGLVLSGGGAKGIAHVGVLKVLEELGIKPDFIAGTSMGSIVGGLYAIGYSADSLATMMSTQNWAEILTNYVPLSEINIEEKDEYNRFLADFKLKKDGIGLPSGIIEGQKLSLLLSKYCWPSYSYNSFSDFPIPFFCVATDLANGDAVVMDNGYLAEAMRASMAIPSVFTAVKVDDKYLVDGGLVSNFPVKEMLARGADIIIGCNVSGGYKKKEDLSSIFSVLMQSTMLLSIQDSEENKAFCDVLIEPDLKGYSTSDFVYADSIIIFGKEAANKKREELIKLLENYNVHRTAVNHESSVIDVQSVKINQLNVIGLSHVSKSIVTGKLGIKPGDWVTVSEIEEGVTRVFGTSNFIKATYKIQNSDLGAILTIQVEEKPKYSAKVAINYNNYSNGGLLLNYTMLNSVLKSSKWTSNIHVSENFSANSKLSKFFGEGQNWCWASDFDFYSYKLNDYKTEAKGSITRFLETDIRSGVDIFPNSFTSLGMRIGYHRFYARPRNFGDFKSISVRNLFASVNLSMNTLNQRYWPKRGFFVDANLSYNFADKYNITTNIYSPLGDSNSQLFVVNRDYHVNMSVRGSYNIPVVENLFTARFDGFIGISTLEDSFIPVYKMGGANFYSKRVIPFVGAKENSIYNNNVSMAQFTGQFNVKDYYCSVIINAGYNSVKRSDFYSRFLKPANWDLGAAISLGYDAVLGPIEVTVSRGFDSGDKVNVYFSFGYRFW